MERHVLNENGVSLVEVLASTVILTLLLTTFLMVFMNSAKTNKTSGEVIDATYTAQKVMEQVYELSTTGSYHTRETGIRAIEQAENNQNPNERVTITLKPIKGTMEHVIVEVFEQQSETLRAKMQNVVVWKEGAT